MLFKRKSKKTVECPKCQSGIESKFSYCPYCGVSLINQEKEMKEFGILGRRDISEEELFGNNFSSAGLGMLDRILASLMGNLMKVMDQQMQDANQNVAKKYHKNIRISVGRPMEKRSETSSNPKKNLTEEQIKKMSEFPRVKAKTTMRRLGDKIVYELNTPGIISPEDVFLARLESGYEIKAIGNKKVYVNNLPINLPINGIKLYNDKVLVEFKTDEEQTI